VSGNSSGRPEVVKEIRELARQHGPAAIERLRGLMDSPDGPVAVAACRAMLDRGYGRPESTVNLPGVGALVSINMGQPITDAVSASAAYAEIMAADGVNFEAITWAPRPPPARPAPAVPQVEVPRAAPAQTSMAEGRDLAEPVPVEGSEDSSTPEPSAPPKSANIRRWEKLGQPEPSPVDPNDASVVAIIQGPSPHVHRALADSRCRHCRQMWVNSI